MVRGHPGQQCGIAYAYCGEVVTRSGAEFFTYSRSRKIPLWENISKPAAKPHWALRCQGSAGSAETTYQEGRRGGVSTARRRPWRGPGRRRALPCSWGARIGPGWGAAVHGGGWTGDGPRSRLRQKKGHLKGGLVMRGGTTRRCALPQRTQDAARRCRSSAGLAQCR